MKKRMLHLITIILFALQIISGPYQYIYTAEDTEIDIPLDFDFELDIPSVEPTDLGNPPSTEPEISFDDFEFKFDSDDELISDTPATAPGTEKGLEISLPFFGAIKLIPFTDIATNKPGLKAKLVNPSKPLKMGQLTIDDGEILWVKHIGITGRATILGQKARFGAKEIKFASGKKDPKAKTKRRFIDKLTLGITFESKPTITLMPGKTITLAAADVIFERKKPVILRFITDFLGKPVQMGFAITKKSLGVFFNLTPNTPFVSLVPGVANTPLEKGIIKTAHLSINNLLYKAEAEKKEEPQKTEPKEEAPKTEKTPEKTETKEEPTGEEKPTETEKEKPATEKAKDEKTQKEDPKGRHIKIEGIIDLSQTELAEAPTIESLKKRPAGKEEAKELGEDYTGLKLTGIISAEGATLTIEAKEFPIKDFATIEQASFSIDTTKKPYSLTLKGKSDITSVPGIDHMNVGIDATLTTKGIDLTGKVGTDVSYAGIALKEATVNFNSENKSFSIQGTIGFQGMTFVASIAVLPDPKDKKKKTTTFTAKATAEEFAPFAKIPGLSTFKVTKLDASVDIIKKNGKTTNSISLKGDLNVFGKPLRSIIKFVENPAGEKGVYFSAPLAEDKSLGDIIPDLNIPPFNQLIFKRAAFQVSSIEFTDTESKQEIPKGVSFVAEVPLVGPLASAGKLMGASGQTFTLEGTILPNTPKLSTFSIILSRGEPDPSKKFSMGKIAIALSGAPSVSVEAELIYRPTAKDTLEFGGKFEFKPDAADLIAQMKGRWPNAFGRKGWAVQDLAFVLGMAYGSPGIPTEFGGAGRFIMKEYLDLEIKFFVSANVSNIGFEGISRQDISLVNVVNIVSEIINQPIPTVKIPSLAIKKHATVKYAMQDIHIGDQIIQAGIAAKGEIDVLGKTATLDIHIGCEQLETCGFKAYASLDPIDILGILKITGYSDAETGIVVDKPKIDIEFTPSRQIFHVSGMLNIADIIKTKTFIELSDKGITFDFEDSLGGDKFTWIDSEGKKTPLLFSKIRGTSSGTLTNPDFVLDIVFKQYLKKYILFEIKKAFDIAEKEVNKAFNDAKKEIDKVDIAITKARKDIDAAEEKVRRARKSIDSINGAIQKSDNAFKKAQRDVDSLQKEINALDKWYNGLPDF
ncbi:MAG TPA: hypothetical protein VGT41_02715 [Candidatus Babeliales bacterium]|nr:hypothetical protein [Candidatus Babeliales bacterium]